MRVERQCSAYYDELFSLQQFDHLLSHSRIRTGDVRIMSHGNETPIQSLSASGYNGGVGTLEYLYAKYRDGHSIAVNGMGQCMSPIKDFCQRLAPEFSARVQVNAYLSPPNEQGLSTHYDSHDVFVLQIWGAKHWCLHEGGFNLPLLQHSYRRTDDPGTVIEEFNLEQGDLLYVPRGRVYTVSSSSTASLHLTVGIHPISWSTIVTGVLQTAVKEDRRFRESLPLGFEREEGPRQAAIVRLKELLETLPNQVDPVAIIDDAAEAARRGTPPSLDGHLTDLVTADNINQSTKLRRRPGIDWKLAEDEEHICLRFHGKEVLLPVHVAPALRDAATGCCFSPASLPGELDEEERLVLVRCLVKEGFLTFAN